MGDSSEIRPSRQTLEATYGKSVQFLRGAGTNPQARARLEAHGYGNDDHAEGWRLVLAAGGYQPAAPAPAEPSSAARDAMVKVDAWDEPTHRILRASLQRRFPEQMVFLLEGLAPATNMAAVAGVTTLLDRLDALESGKDRQGSRKQDKAALGLISGRGITAEKRQEMRALAQQAQQGEAAAPADPARDKARADRDQAHEDALLALRHWYEEWSEIARVAVTRRDHLILLGLAKRKTTKKEG
jgi:hypothetical protein